MKCKYEHDGDCCNCGSPQYMCKCKPKICNSEVPMTNADRIRAMSDEELAEWLTEFAAEAFAAGVIKLAGPMMTQEERLDWLRQPADAE